MDPVPACHCRGQANAGNNTFSDAWLRDQAAYNPTVTGAPCAL